MGALFMKDDIINKKEFRYNSLKDAIKRLKEVIDEQEKIDSKKLGSILNDAIIKRFEFTFELMWKVLKEYLEDNGFTDFMPSPKSVLKYAFKNGIINDEQGYNLMLQDRNSTTHIYDEKMASQIVKNIKGKYVALIQSLIDYLDKEEYLAK